MKKNIERYQEFIKEQKIWFCQFLSENFNHTWNDNIWLAGSNGSGWLRGNGKNVLRFDEIYRLKGINERIRIKNEYSDFMKAILIMVYRKRNNTISPSVATATLMILKRWYYSLIKITNQSHPIYLTTDVIKNAMDILSAVSSEGDPNVANYKGRCINLQKIVNHSSFTLVTLQYISNTKYSNHTNLTKKARETMEYKKYEQLNDNDNGNELITIRGFLNIVELIRRVDTITEKIALNYLLLLIITGFRSVEAFNLRYDALIKRHIDDPDVRNQLRDKGLSDYFLGIKYVGVKGAGERIHWVEPLAAPLVESIFKTIITLTSPMREHLRYLRKKNFHSYLPKPVCDIDDELIELDDVIKYIACSSREFNERAKNRDIVKKALTNRSIKPFKEISIKINNGSLFFYKKDDISNYIKNEFKIKDKNTPCSIAWSEHNKHYEVNYEDLLFLHIKGTLTFKKSLILLSNPIPFDNVGINRFLGNKDCDASIFSKYQLLEDDGKPTTLRTHIPRHNINTFLAIADVSEHLQAMLMGRMDITQNHHYQHLALNEKRKAASLISTIHIENELQHELKTEDIIPPSSIIKQTEYMTCSEKLDLTNNIKSNLHTFDDRNDIASFIESSFSSGLFQDIAEAFEEINNKDCIQKASEMVKRHAILNPLKFGSCMRNVGLWGCPYRLKCQAIQYCEHFTLTGRIDEYSNIKNKKNMLQNAKKQVLLGISSNSIHNEIVENINTSLQYLDSIEIEWKHRAESQYLIDINSLSSGNINFDEKVKTLAALFALECHQLKKDK